MKEAGGQKRGPQQNLGEQSKHLWAWQPEDLTASSSQHLMPGSGSILAPLMGLGDQVTRLDARAMVSPARLSGFPAEADFGKDT